MAVFLILNILLATLVWFALLKLAKSKSIGHYLDGFNRVIITLVCCFILSKAYLNNDDYAKGIESTYSEFISSQNSIKSVKAKQKELDRKKEIKEISDKFKNNKTNNEIIPEQNNKIVEKVITERYIDPVFIETIKIERIPEYTKETNTNYLKTESNKFIENEII